MKLNRESIKNKEAWKGYKLPKYDLEMISANTKERPNWIHFGAGNIFRAFQANVLNNLLNEGKTDVGLIVAEGYDYEIIDAAYQKQDNLGIYVKLNGEGSIDKTVIGSVLESLKLDSANKKDFDRLKEIFRKPSLQMASFTITEKGYSLVNGKGEIVPEIAEDLKEGPQKVSSYLGKVAALLYERYKAGELPIAMVSMDNCSHNGDKLKSAMITIASRWVQNGVADAGFEAYVDNPDKVTFPWSMIDKITPRPDDKVKEILINDGLEDMDPVITSKSTYVAPFVNAEESEYLVIEDAFPNGHPPIDLGGVIFTQREIVDKVEKMKVCTCLNPLHTTLAVFGCLLSYTKISDEMKDPDLKRLVERVGYVEGLPVVVDPGIINPKEFIDTVVNVRIPNPFMPDTPQRIACDTSQKLAIRFGETIKAYVKSPDLDVKSLKGIPLVLAGWCRYLMGIDDQGNKFELSPDPMLDKVCPIVADIKLGDKVDIHKVLQPLLSDESIFGVNLYECGLGELVESYFSELISGTGAVRATIKKYV